MCLRGSEIAYGLKFLNLVTLYNSCKEVVLFSNEFFEKKNYTLKNCRDGNQFSRKVKFFNFFARCLVVGTMVKCKSAMTQ